MNNIHIEEVENGFIVSVDGGIGYQSKRHVFAGSAELGEFIADTAYDAEEKRKAKDVKA